MGNKDEKTFTDLFSNSTTEAETNTQTFGDLLKGSSIKEEAIEETPALTLDSIFDRIPETKSEEEAKSNIAEPKILDFNSIFTETIESTNDKKNNYSVTEEANKDNEVSNPREEIISQEITFNPFLEERTEGVPELPSETKVIEPNTYEEEVMFEDNSIFESSNLFSTNDNTEEIDNSNKDESQKTDMDFLGNLFFDNNETNSMGEPQINSEEETSNILGSNPFFIEDASKTGEPTIPKTLESNLFFEENTKIDNTNTIIKEDDDNSVLSNQPIGLQKGDNDFSGNLFFDNDGTNSMVEPQINSEEETNNILGSNPFFTEDTSKTVEVTVPKPLESNLFFEENTKIDNTNIKKDNLSSVLSNQSMTSSNESLEPKSTSPFFEMEKKSEENPFFQNQINLIENQVPNNPNNGIDTSKSKHYNVKIVKKKEPLIKVILGVLSYALFIWLLLIGTTLLVYVLDIKIRAAKGDYSSPTFNAYVVLTGSMLPEIQVKDVVVTKKVDAKDLKEGDVITFASADTRFSGTIITHRIMKKNPPIENQGYTFQTKGDNNNVVDSALVPEANIYGKVILKIPKLGYLQEFLASDGGWIIVILIPCLTVMSYDIVKLIKGMKRKKYKNIKVQK